MVMSQSRLKESAGIAVMKMAMDTGKETATQITEMMKSVSVDPNIGQHFDAMVQQQMDEKEELKQELKQELQWVQYRQKTLDIMEEKLLQMKLLAEQAKERKLSPEGLKALNNTLNNLATQVRALDGESRRTEDKEILE